MLICKSLCLSVYYNISPSASLLPSACLQAAAFTLTLTYAAENRLLVGLFETQQVACNPLI